MPAPHFVCLFVSSLQVPKLLSTTVTVRYILFKNFGRKWGTVCYTYIKYFLSFFAKIERGRKPPPHPTHPPLMHIRTRAAATV